jgi:hypothetical protein
MTELIDFLVWLTRQRKDGKICYNTLIVTAAEVIDYLRELENAEKDSEEKSSSAEKKED